MAGTTPPFMPPGYSPALPTGLMSADQVKLAGAPDGYTWDSVKQAYVPIVGSASNANNLQMQSGALAGLAGVGGAVGGGQVNPPSTIPYGYQPGAAPTFDVTTPAEVSRMQGGTPDQERASQSAIYAQTKDNAANATRAAMTALQGELQARGMGGGGYEAGQIGQNLSREANTIGEADRQQAVEQLKQAQHVADVQYSGDVQQRAQNIGIGEGNANRSASLYDSAEGRKLSAANAAYSGGIQQRGQDMNNTQSQNALRLQQQAQALASLKSSQVY